MACCFPAVPRGRARKPHGKEPWLQEEAALPPRQRFWYSQNLLCFLPENELLRGISREHLPVLPSLDLSRAGSL